MKMGVVKLQIAYAFLLVTVLAPRQEASADATAVRLCRCSRPTTLTGVPPWILLSCNASKLLWRTYLTC